jgi:beta-barrel assembly-enhancing protease
MTRSVVHPNRPFAPLVALLSAAAWASPSAQALDEVEQRERIAHQASMFEARLRNGAQQFADPELDAYLNEILDRLFPDHAERLHVHALRDPEFNAFALASGAIYFNTGALLRLQDEAQLASVLGHEGTHVLADHIYRRVVGAKGTAAAVTIAGEVVAP